MKRAVHDGKIRRIVVYGGSWWSMVVYGGPWWRKAASSSSPGEGVRLSRKEERWWSSFSA